MKWLLPMLLRWLFGPAFTDGVSEERMDGITLAMREEAERLSAWSSSAGPGRLK